MKQARLNLDTCCSKQLCSTFTSDGKNWFARPNPFESILLVNRTHFWFCCCRIYIILLVNSNTYRFGFILLLIFAPSRCSCTSSCQQFEHCDSWLVSVLWCFELWKL